MIAMAKPRRRQAYTPALLENLRFRFEQTDESVLDIAASFARSHTTLRKLAREEGWTKFVPPPLDVSPAARLAAEAAQLNNLSRRPVEGGASSTLPARAPRASLAGGGETEPPPPPPTTTSAADLSVLAPDARMARLSEMARVIDFQLALLRQKQAHPQRGEDTKAINAEVKNFAATAAIIEHQLRDLQNGRSTPLPNETNDDIPEDIDAFRLRLAAKIEAFLERRPDIGDGDEDPGEGHRHARP